MEYSEIIYLLAAMLGFALTFKCLRGLNIEHLFKEGHVWEIKVAYLIICLVFAHIIGSLFEHLSLFFFDI
jgi:uncharacterized membrane protein YwzB